MKNSANSIRTFGSLLIAMVMMIAFNSCSGYTTIEKRHYRDGFYVSKSKSSVKAETNEIPATTAFSEKEVSTEVKSVPENSIKHEFVPNTTVTINTIPVQQNSIHKESPIQNVKVEQKKIFKPLMSDTLIKKSDKPEHPVSKKEKLGRTGYIIFMSVVVAFVIVIVAAIAAFIITIASYSSIGSGGII
ncbi:MAG TPA: hypothetical protein VFJ43_17770 [Bacteroidia bacterium]|nr:hypothetical protein [Bacteroidia bacterium]